MENEGRITERDLLFEMLETMKDIRMYRDKISVYCDEEGNITDPRVGREGDLNYLKHVSKLDRWRDLIEMGNKYLSGGNVDWNDYELPSGLKDVSLNASVRTQF